MMLINLNNFSNFLQVNEWTFTEIVTYIILPIGGLVGFIVRYVIPKLVDAKVLKDKDALDHSQEMDLLQFNYRQNQESAGLAMMGDILLKTQEEKADVYRFIRQEIKEALDRIKADTSLLVDISKRVGELEHQSRNIVTYQRIINDYLTGLSERDKRDD